MGPSCGHKKKRAEPTSESRPAKTETGGITGSSTNRGKSRQRDTNPAYFSTTRVRATHKANYPRDNLIIVSRQCQARSPYFHTTFHRNIAIHTFSQLSYPLHHLYLPCDTSSENLFAHEIYLISNCYNVYPVAFCNYFLRIFTSMLFQETGLKCKVSANNLFDKQRLCLYLIASSEYPPGFAEEAKSPPTEPSTSCI